MKISEVNQIKEERGDIDVGIPLSDYPFHPIESLDWSNFVFEEGKNKLVIS